MNTVGYSALAARSGRGCLFWGLLLGALGMALFVGLLGLLFVFGIGVFSEQAQTAMQENAVIREHIGQIRSAELDYVASMNHPDMDTFVFDLDGDKGKGQVTAEFITVDADTEALGEGSLRLADGRQFDLGGEPGESRPELELDDKSTVKP